MDRCGLTQLCKEVTLTTSYKDFLHLFPDNKATDFITLYRDSGGYLSLINNNTNQWMCALTRIVLRQKPLKGKKKDSVLTINTNIIESSYYLGQSIPVLNYINFKSGQKLVDVEFTNPIYHKVSLTELGLLKFESRICDTDNNCIDEPYNQIDNLTLTLHFKTVK